MYPDVPFQGISWPMTQHAGVLSKEVLDGLLHACMLCNNQKPDAGLINNYMIENGILTANYRADSNQSDAWRDYQQILSEFGFIYSTRVSRKIRLTPVSLAYLSGRLSYEEAFSLQVMRYQYPNGHKSQLSPSLKESYGPSFCFGSYTELQASLGICLRPAVVVWMVLSSLWEMNERPVVSINEMQSYVARCMTHNDIPACVQAIVDSRKGVYEMPPLPRARRNMADWIKILGQTPLFRMSQDADHLSLSTFSVRKRRLIKDVCIQLSQPTTFWYYKNEDVDYKANWFDFYGNFDNNTDWVIKTT